jgi:MFS family permease
MTRETTTRESAGPGGRAPRQRQGGLAVLRVLRHREFAIFWCGQLISLIGTWMQAFAQGWVVTSLTSSAMALGFVNFCSSAPTLLLMPFGGVAADRMERRRILIVTQWVMLVLALVMGWLVATHRLAIWHVYVIALLLGVAAAYDMPAFQSFYPQLVDREDLPQAISLNQAAFNGSRIIGPALAGFAVKLWGTAAAFFANAASFVAVIVSLSLIRARPPAVEAGRQSTWAMMREGFAYVRQRPRLQALLGMTGITTLFIFPNMAVLTPYYAQHVLHVGPDGLGTMMSMSGVGALLGSFLLLTVPPEQRVARMALAAFTALGTLSALAWSHHLWVSSAAISLQSLAISTSMGLASIIVQEAVPDALRGRVMSLWSLMFIGVMPVSSLLVSSVIDIPWIGMRRELQFSAVAYASCAALLLWRVHTAGDDPSVTAGPQAEAEPTLAIADD